jgi:hypothetical protein
MGQSPSAYLYYGIKIPGSDSYLSEGDEGYEAQEWRKSILTDEADDFDPEDFLTKLLGLENPWDEIKGMSNEEYAAFKNTPGWKERSTKWFSIKANALEACPVTFGNYGSYEFGGHILHLTGVEASATHWEEEAIDLDAILAKVTPETIAEARSFCHTHGLPSFESPKWWLCPSFG